MTVKINENKTTVVIKVRGKSYLNRIGSGGTTKPSFTDTPITTPKEGDKKNTKTRKVWSNDSRKQNWQKNRQREYDSDVMGSSHLNTIAEEKHYSYQYDTSEGEEENLDLAHLDMVEVSLSLVTDLTSPQTNKLKGVHGGTEVVILVDSDATHDFL